MNIHYFVAMLRFVAIYAVFGRLKAIKFANLQLRAQNDAFVAKIVMAIFALAERLPTSATLVGK